MWEGTRLVTMTGIWEYPDLDGLERFIVSGVERSREFVIDQDSERSGTIADLTVERVVVDGEWGNGTAARGEDDLSIIVFFDYAAVENPHLDPEFDPAIREVVAAFTFLINEDEIDVPDTISEWFGGIEPRPGAITQIPEVINRTLGQQEGTTVFDLTRAEAIENRQDVRFRNLPRIPLERLKRTDEDEEEETSTGDYLPGSVPSPEEEDEEEEEEFPHINETVREFAVSDDVLQIPAGKETKKIQVREPYDFEKEMSKPGTEVDSSTAQRVMDEIGASVGAGRFGEEDPPGTFPRTGAYIRNRLKFEGPAYVYQIYKDLVFYSGYISGIYDSNFDAGTYNSFRRFIEVLNGIAEQTGTYLIEPISQNQASAMGLETIPDHPTVEGEKAPWLERRQYYMLVEENQDHDAWKNAYDYLYTSQDGA